ncbi:MAG: hypothetical protein E5W86_12995, partial [Mesorhizobium sp.]
MVAYYKIHPGIGIARVGRSPDGFFLRAEFEEGEPFELAAGEEVAFGGYKDASRLIRRQGVRFRIYEYDRDPASGSLTFVREVTPDVASIEWRVTLANSKAAGLEMTAGPGLGDSLAIVPNTQGVRRNVPPAGGNVQDFVASVDFTVAGLNQPFGPRKTGTVGGVDVFLGEVCTDASGRLVVLGGEGKSQSWVAPAPRLEDYLNNPGWFDDVADGPVDATITIAGQPGAVPVNEGAWVVIGPPDFAPDVVPIVSLYDIMSNALQFGTPPAISFVQDVLPILHRVASHFWTNRLRENEWQAVRTALNANLSSLADPSDAADQLRLTIFNAVLKAQDLRQLRLTPAQQEILEDWRDGSFLPGPDPSRPVGN